MVQCERSKRTRVCSNSMWLDEQQHTAKNIALWTTNISLCCSSTLVSLFHFDRFGIVRLYATLNVLYLVSSLSRALCSISILTLYGDTILYLWRKCWNVFFSFLLLKTHPKNKILFIQTTSYKIQATISNGYRCGCDTKIWSSVFSLTVYSYFEMAGV